MRIIEPTVKSHSKAGVRYVFLEGRASSSVKLVFPKEQQRQFLKKNRGKPVECHAWDAGLSNGDCLSKNVVHSMCCLFSSVDCGDEYVGETERSLCVRFQ